MNILELLRQKEEELQRVQKELEALRIVARMVEDAERKTPSANVTPISALAGVPLAATPRVERENVQGYGDVAGRQFP